MNEENDWLSGKEKHNKQKQARRRMSGDAGKGDASRITNLTKFRLGFDLQKLADAGLKDSDEYRATLNAWRNA